MQFIAFKAENKIDSNYLRLKQMKLYIKKTFYYFVNIYVIFKLDKSFVSCIIP